jgi:membrane protein
VPRRWPDKLRQLLLDMVVQGRRLRLQQAAASLSFLSLLAAVPILSIGLSVFTALPVFARLRDDLEQFLSSNLFPEAFNEVVIERLNEFAARASGLSSIGALAFFLTALTALRVIERTMNQIWGVRSRRGLFHRLGLYWVLLTLGPLLLAATVALSTDLIADALQRLDAPALRSAWFQTVPWLTGIAVIWLLFRALPATRVDPWHALAGTLLSVVLIAGLQQALTAYLRQLPTYEVVYGAFAALPLFLLWLFAVWAAFLSGALLTANLRQWGDPGRRAALDWPGARFAQAREALESMAARSGGRPRDTAMPAHELRELLDDDAYRLEALALLLEESGYIIRYLPLAELAPAGSGWSYRPTRWLPATRRSRAYLWHERWAWAADPAELSLRPLFETVWWGEPRAAGPASRPTISGDDLDRPLSACARLHGA